MRSVFLTRSMDSGFEFGYRQVDSMAVYFGGYPVSYITFHQQLFMFTFTPFDYPFFNLS